MNYLFGKTEWPLILIILGSTAMGGIIVASFGWFRMFKLQWQIKILSKEKEELKKKISALEENEPLEQEQS